MAALFRGSFETEQANGNESMTVVDLEDLEDEEESGVVSPSELTKINFRSLIGHTDEVGNVKLNFLVCLKCYGSGILLWGDEGRGPEGGRGGGGAVCYVTVFSEENG